MLHIKLIIWNLFLNRYENEFFCHWQSTDNQKNVHKLNRSMIIINSPKWKQRRIRIKDCSIAITRLFTYVVSNHVDDDKMQLKCGTPFSHMIVFNELLQNNTVQTMNRASRQTFYNRKVNSEHEFQFERKKKNTFFPGFRPIIIGCTWFFLKRAQCLLVFSLVSLTFPSDSHSCSFACDQWQQQKFRKIHIARS